MALETRCPICLDSWEEEASYVLPCLHQFCYSCILQWSENSPECPLCRRRMTSIMQSGQGDDNFQEHIISPPSGGEEPSGSDHQRGVAPRQPAAHSPHHSAASQTLAILMPRHPVAGLCPHIWAYFFRHDPSLLRPLMPWLRQWLCVIFQGRLWEAEAARMFVLCCLEFYGLDEEPLVQILQNALGEYTTDFVRRLIAITVEHCSGEVRQRLGLDDDHVAEGREGSSAAGPGLGPGPGPAASGGWSLARNPSASRSEAQLLSTSSADLHGGPGSAPSVPVSGSREPRVPQEEPEEAVPGPSTASQGSQHFPGQARRAPKRKASRPEGASQPSKKPPCHQ